MPFRIETSPAGLPSYVPEGYTSVSPLQALYDKLQALYDQLLASHGRLQMRVGKLEEIAEELEKELADHESNTEFYVNSHQNALGEMKVRMETAESINDVQGERLAALEAIVARLQHEPRRSGRIKAMRG